LTDTGFWPAAILVWHCRCFQVAHHNTSPTEAARSAGRIRRILMKRAALCVLSLVLAWALPVAAQSERSVSGKIVSSSASQLVIQTDDGRQMTFDVDTQSTVPSGLQAGGQVTVRYHELAGGRFHAANVTSTAATPERETTTAATPPDPATTTAQPPVTETRPDMDRPAAAPDIDAEGRRELPATASPLPLFGLSGLLALGAGLGLRALRRR
jgi:hypothetical protein